MTKAATTNSGSMPWGERSKGLSLRQDWSARESQLSQVTISSDSEDLVNQKLVRHGQKRKQYLYDANEGS